MTQDQDFDLRNFLPYLLNQAADVTSREFEAFYKTKYGMLRTEWRVLFHLGRYGDMTAKDICDRARIHKTKVSRAVQALEDKRYLSRQERADDRRHENLSLTASGAQVFTTLLEQAKQYDSALWSEFSAAEARQIRSFLVRLAKL